MSEYPRLPLPPPPPPYNSGGRTTVPGFMDRQHGEERQFLDQPSTDVQVDENASLYRSRSIQADIRPIPECGSPCRGCGCKPLRWSAGILDAFWYSPRSAGVGRPFIASDSVVGRVPDAFGVTVSSPLGQCRIDSVSMLITVGPTTPGTSGTVAPGTYNRGRWTQVFGADQFGVVPAPVPLFTSPVQSDAYVFPVGSLFFVGTAASFSGWPLSYDGQGVTIEATAFTGSGGYGHYRKWYYPPLATPRFDPTGQQAISWSSDPRNTGLGFPTLMESIDCCALLGDSPRNEIVWDVDTTPAKVSQTSRSRTPYWTTPLPAYHEEIYVLPAVPAILTYEKLYQGSSGACGVGCNRLAQFRKIMFNKTSDLGDFDYNRYASGDAIAPASAFYPNSFREPRTYADLLLSCQCVCS